MYSRTYRNPRRQRGSGLGRLIMAGVIALVSLISYFGSRQDNPVTGETQYIGITVEQEIALGLQAAPQMAEEFGGLDPSQQDQAIVDQTGNLLVQSSAAVRTPYEYEFHLLEDEQTINAFALPGGQIFITRALYDQLQTEGELAGVLGHEIGHVVARHSAEHIAKAKLTEGLTGAAVIATYDPENPASASSAQVAALIGQLINLKFGREDELESDFLGVCFMNDSGYDPSDLITVMQILAASRQSEQPPEFFSTHPNPESRVQRIQEAIRDLSACPG
ncbi:MAG TPA: M48 family metalloprotease [Anaerolineales bacterium]|nr:M48 family metalloprotease [Anaerolineales bacterium]